MMKNRRGVAVVLGVLALGSILAMTSCGPSVDLTGWFNGGNTGGTGVGPVTGFGSVIVNGIRYDDAGIDGTSFFDDHGRDKSGLMSGMMVAVFGSIDGANGTADNITVLRHVDGPMDDNGVDLSANRLKVMGQDVLVDASTVFDNGITNLADLRTLQGANVSHPELEVQGCADNNGVIHATFIHKWADDRLGGRDVQVRGTVSGLDTAARTFLIGRKTVDYDALGVLPAGVGDGSFVEAKGMLRAPDNALVATSVKLEDATGGQPSGSRAEVEGYVDRVVTPNLGFELLGPNGVQTVTWATGTTSFRDGTPADILAGVKVEVEGVRKADRSLAATRISFRKANNVRMESFATSVTTVSLTVFGKTVKVNELTQYKDSRDGLPTFGRANIAVNDALRIAAFLDDTAVPASIVATRVERIGPIGTTGHILQGPVDLALSPDLAILGITVTTTPTTTFLRADGTAFAAQEDFFAAVATGDIVKARGNQATPIVLMFANEVQIEPTSGN